MTGCLRATPADDLPVLASIQPDEPCRKGATLSLARRAMEPGHLHHSALTCPSSGNTRHLKSRHLFVPGAQQSHQFIWRHQQKCLVLGGSLMECGKLESTTKLRTFNPVPSSWNVPAKNSVCPAQLPPHRCQTFPVLFAQMEYGLLWDLWVWRRRSDRWPLLSSNIQSIDLHMEHGLTVLDDETIDWLLNTYPWI